MEQKVTSKEIAQYLGMSQSTVSRALKGKLVSQKTIAKVKKAAKEFGYRPNLSARNLVTGKSFTIGLLVPEMANPYCGTLVERLHAKALKIDYQLIIGCYEKQVAKLDQFIDEMRNGRRVDGLIICPMHDGRIQSVINKYADGSFPVLLMGHSDNLHVSTVSVNFKCGLGSAVDHLVDFGHRRIGVIIPYVGNVLSPEESLKIDPRVISIHETFQSRGVELDSELLLTGDSSLSCGMINAEKLLTMTNPPTAILACSDQIASGVVAAARRLDLRYPKDFSLIGYDNTDYSELFDITTVNNLEESHFEDMIMIMKRLIDKSSKDLKMSLIFEPKLIVRGSTGPV